MNENSYIKTVATYYGILLVLFAAIYYLLLWHNPNHFYIPPHITDKRKQDNRVYISNRLQELEKSKKGLIESIDYEKKRSLFAKKILTQKEDKRIYLSDTFAVLLPKLILFQKPDSIKALTKEDVSIFPKNPNRLDTIGSEVIFFMDTLMVKITTETYYSCSPRGGCRRTDDFVWELNIVNRYGEKVFINRYVTNSSDKYLSELTNFSGKYLLDKHLYLKYCAYVCSSPANFYEINIVGMEDEIKRKEDEISQYKDKILKNEIDWGILDIAYFTVVSLGLSNYSDITPNCTLSRTLVLIEQLISIYLLVYAINLKINSIVQNNQNSGRDGSENNIDNSTE